MSAIRRTQIIATTVLLMTMVALGGLVGRVAWSDRRANAEQMDPVAKQSTATAEVMANRGTIRMGDGQVLAASVRMYNLYADPAYIMDPTGKIEARWKLQKELNAMEAGNPDAEGLKAQIDALSKQIDDSKTNTAAARENLAAALAPLLGVQPGEVLGMIQDNETRRRKDAAGIELPSDPTKDSPRRFLWLSREVDETFFANFQKTKADLHEQAKKTLAEAKSITDQKAREKKRAEADAMARALDGVGFQLSIKRIYPMGSMAAHLVGFASSEGLTRDNDGRLVWNGGGVDGIERQFDDILHGKPGAMELLKDARRTTLMIEDKGYKPQENGYNLWLSLDTMVQSIAEKELADACVKFKAESGVAIVMDPFTGKVLAMASYPTFNAMDFSKTPPDIRRNRAVVDPIEAGSVLKPFNLAWAIEHGIVTPTTLINCENGLWHDPTGRAVKDDYAYPIMPAEDVLVKSSNVGMSKIGWMMGIPMLCDGVHTFGFGGLTGIELPGDSKGILKPESKWNKGTLTSVSFGYEIGVTPIQLIRAFATFTNGGYLVTPRVVEAVEVEPGRAVRWEDLAGVPERKQILSAKTCDTMRDMMEQVYVRGTAKSAISSIYRLYGKTGTAHLTQGKAGYASNEYNSSFMSGGPVSKPRLVTVVTLHKPDKSLGHFGGTVAAPAATRIMEQSLEYMQVKPDQPEKTTRH